MIRFLTALSAFRLTVVLVLLAACVTAEQELALGKSEHPKILQQFGGENSDPKIRNYVADLGKRLAAKSEMPDLDWHFTVLNSDIVNAFALPGGYVYVTRGLLALASTESELAGVLGHEIGHVTHRHGAQRMNRATGANVGTTILGAGVAILTGSSQLGSAVAQITGLGAQTYLASYSRDQEFEADGAGVRYLANAGYEPLAMARFLEKLQRDSQLQAELAGRPGSADTFNIMQSHPRTPDRVREAAADAKDVPRPNNPRVGAEDYLAVVNGMAVGGDEQNGYIRNRIFIHPGMRLRFEVPRGFHLVDQPDSVIALGPNGSMIRFGADSRAPRGDGAALANYLAQARLANIERITVDGLAGATGAGRVSGNQGEMDVRHVLLRDNDAVWHFVFASRPQNTASLSEAFRRTTYSFEKLTAQEAATARPFRIRVVRVGPNDTQETMARRMVVEDLPLRQFQVLNHLQPEDRLRPGQLVKIIAD